jgi:hypothetical protein
VLISYFLAIRHLHLWPRSSRLIVAYRNTSSFAPVRPRDCRPGKKGLPVQVVWQYRWPCIASEVFSRVIIVPVSM